MVFAGSLAWWLIARAAGGVPAARGEAPWYLYSGGVWGLLIVSCAAVAYPRLGAATTTTLAIAGQIVTAILLDQLGATGRHLPLTTARLAGVLLVALGTWLVVASSSKS
jgi:bacterial/archaeal transporter family-2 protein